MLKLMRKNKSAYTTLPTMSAPFQYFPILYSLCLADFVCLRRGWKFFQIQEGVSIFPGNISFSDIKEAHAIFSHGLPYIIRG